MLFSLTYGRNSRKEGMPFFKNPQDFLVYKKEKCPLLGIDLGDKTIGLALSDRTWFIASPYDTIQRKTLRVDMRLLQLVITKENVGGLVVGLPLNMDGTKGPRVQATEQFFQHFLKGCDVPVCFWDERLSTRAVERAMIVGDLSRQKRAKHVDKLAASYILQGFLDALSTNQF